MREQNHYLQSISVLLMTTITFYGIGSYGFQICFLQLPLEDLAEGNKALYIEQFFTRLLLLATKQQHLNRLQLCTENVRMCFFR